VQGSGAEQQVTG